MNSKTSGIGLPSVAILVATGLIAWATWAPLPETRLVDFDKALPSVEVDLNKSQLPGLDEFAKVWNKQLYTPMVAEPPPAASATELALSDLVVPEPPQPEPSLILVQVLFAETARLAVFEEKSTKKRVRLMEDQVYDGLKVIKILPETVMTEFAGRTVELSLQSATSTDKGR